MSVLTRVAGAYLVLLAVAVGVHFVITPLYHPGGDEPFPVWEILNWFMAAGMIIGVACTFWSKRRVDANDSADLKPYLESNVLFYANAALFLLFFWNWFSNLSPNNTADSQFWAVIDTLMPIVLGATGCRMLRNPSG